MIRFVSTIIVLTLFSAQGYQNVANCDSQDAATFKLSSRRQESSTVLVDKIVNNQVEKSELNQNKIIETIGNKLLQASRPATADGGSHLTQKSQNSDDDVRGDGEIATNEEDDVQEKPFTSRLLAREIRSTSHSLLQRIKRSGGARAAMRSRIRLAQRPQTTTTSTTTTTTTEASSGSDKEDQETSAGESEEEDQEKLIEGESKVRKLKTSQKSVIVEAKPKARTGDKAKDKDDDDDNDDESEYEDDDTDKTEFKPKPKSSTAKTPIKQPKKTSTSTPYPPKQKEEDEDEEEEEEKEADEKGKQAPTTTTTLAPIKSSLNRNKAKNKAMAAEVGDAKKLGQKSEGNMKGNDNSDLKNDNIGEGSSIQSSDSTKLPAEDGSITKGKKKKPLVALPFIRPKNESICTRAAYLEFPHDRLGNKWPFNGVIVHIAVVCYMFYSLALVCERYFMPSLEEFAQRLQLSEDVAGATLMSAGSSAPELFTAILGVFVAKGDVGTGAIVGSAVFNILFVIGICAFVSTTTAHLNWWPVLRDSVYYTFTVLVLILFIYDERITAFESFTMIALYGVYILIMINNEAIKERVTQFLLSHPITSKLISSQATADEGGGGPDEVFGGGGVGIGLSPNSKGKGFFGDQSSKKNYQTTAMIGSGEKTVEEDSMFLAACLVIVQHKRLFKSQLRFQSAARYIIIKRQHKIQQQQKSIKCSNEVNYFGPESELLKGSGSGQRERMEAYAKGATMSKNKFSIVSKDDYEFWNRPPEEGENYYIWLAKIPVNYVLHYTIPDCTLYPDTYLFTFLISILWTAFFSYIMVWMVTLIGYAFGIPDSVMGVTFLAAGTSVPDCYSSIHAARNGMADMAVSNSIGSNVFDILIGLSLPWFIQTAIYPGVVATINSRGVIYSVILLFLSLIVTIYLMNKYEWTLKPRLGLALLIAYGLFIVLTCMLEFNLFGHVNPPPCPV